MNPLILNGVGQFINVHFNLPRTRDHRLVFPLLPLRIKITLKPTTISYKLQKGDISFLIDLIAFHGEHNERF